MTPKEIVMLADRKARAQGFKWALVQDYKTIRCLDGRCPLEVAADYPRGDFSLAAADLGLSNQDTWCVVDTADNNTRLAFNPALRALMLRTFDFGSETEAK